MQFYTKLHEKLIWFKIFECLGSKLAILLSQIGRKFSDLYSGMHLYTIRPDIFEVRKVHFGLTFGACTIALVSNIGACTTGEFGIVLKFCVVFRSYVGKNPLSYPNR